MINDPENVVAEMLEGFAKANPSLEYFPEFEVITRREKKSAKVGLVSGGGSGHEPAHAGYVGRGMLDAAVSGDVFTSPSPDRVLKSIREAESGRGVLLVIKNYTGDVMNFEMARDIARSEGIEAESVVVNDDVAVPDSTYSAGRRGIAGTVFVHKIAGAKAEAGAPLAEVKEIAERVIANVRSMGMAMTPCTLPAAGRAGFSLGDGEIEIGMGIHGEPGVKRTGIMTARELAKTMTEKILDDLGYAGSEAALMINGLGGTPLMELCVLNGEVGKILAAARVEVHRTFIGNYMTSLEMAGASVSLLRLDAEMKELLGRPCDAPAFKII
ncbi:MAG: dihydroxyacetone kinase subunit DhaK [Synergistaceae bacterium]|nr:dihydroxyacetone kinase subunit DhaK [Synergistaceae bacterium]